MHCNALYLRYIHLAVATMALTTPTCGTRILPLHSAFTSIIIECCVYACRLPASVPVVSTTAYIYFICIRLAHMRTASHQHRCEGDAVKCLHELRCMWIASRREKPESAKYSWAQWRRRRRWMVRCFCCHAKISHTGERYYMVCELSRRHSRWRTHWMSHYIESAIVRHPIV